MYKPINNYLQYALVALLFTLFTLPAPVLGQGFPQTFVGGEMDDMTPAIRLLRVIDKKDGIQVRVKLSKEFTFCGECAAPLPDEYGQVPQVPNQGHVHVYFRKAGRKIRKDRLADGFCAFNVFNPSTEEIRPNVWQSMCPKPEPGFYQVCAVVETDAHAQRVKAAPRDFPPIDCRYYFQEWRGGDAE